MPAYDDVQRYLGEPGGAESAEAHGTLVGLMCLPAGDLPGAWVENTLGDAGLASGPGGRALLQELHQATMGDLEGARFAFQPLLPADDAPLGLRAAALARWCQGFLYGLAVRGLKDKDALPADLREIVEDLAEISQAGLAGDEARETAEEAYAELVEYLRVGVQVIYYGMEEGSGTRTPPTDAGHVH